MQLFPASAVLKPYVKGYTVFTTDMDMTDQLFYPSGYVDFAVNISNGNVITAINGRPIDMPRVEVLGQLTLPTRLTVTRGTMVLIARIYPHANSLFFPNPISDFTNDSIDLDDVIGKVSNELYHGIMQVGSIEQKVQVLDTFLIRQMSKSRKIQSKVTLIEELCRHISTAGELFDIQSVSGKYALSERYIQRLFLDNVGITPRTFFNIRRFNKSLALIQASGMSLTSIAYDCGYYDQAHFIKEFKKFTGLTPSEGRSLHALGQI